MKYSIFVITTTLFTIIDGFTPLSSFTSSYMNHHNIIQYNDFNKKTQFVLHQRRNKNRTEMKMMFDQLATAISDVAKNIGGRSR